MPLIVAQHYKLYYIFKDQKQMGKPSRWKHIKDWKIIKITIKSFLFIIIFNKIFECHLMILVPNMPDRIFWFMNYCYTEWHFSRCLL